MENKIIIFYLKDAIPPQEQEIHTLDPDDDTESELVIPDYVETEEQEKPKDEEKEERMYIHIICKIKFY